MKRVRNVVEEFRVTAAELAFMFDLSVARVGQLTKLGVFEKGADRDFDLQLSFGFFSVERRISESRARFQDACTHNCPLSGCRLKRSMQHKH